MVKDKKAVFDGWYWSYHAPNYAPANPSIDYPDSGFGLYCLRCHASAERESTFSTVKHVEGSPISFNVEMPTMLPLPPEKEDMHSRIARTPAIAKSSFATPRTSPNPNLLNLLKRMPDVTAQQLLRFPGESFDHVVPSPGGPNGFLTSSQCMGCHSATNDDMLYPFGESNQKPINLSPYTEWRASMMGLAGRDPIFHAQLESEKALYPSRAEFFDNTCYRCHAVILPVSEKQGKKVVEKTGQPKEFHEQMTYPEWQNSIYQNEREPINHTAARTCQDCHMPRDFKGRQIISRIANIEDNNYPYTDYRAPDKEIALRIRDQYSRHTLVGLNEFGLMMFQQFPQVLGIRTSDYMFDQSALGLETAQNSSTDLAQNQTARISVTSLERKEKFVEATIEVENLAGHGLPSGVAFRRVFITFEALDEKGDVIWASGRTNNVGAIVQGASDEVMPTEFFYDPITRKQVFQPHYQIISDENNAQIYEELIAVTEGKITTSFIGLDRPVKNNRLLPKGWRADGPFAEFTRPHGDAERDADYLNGSAAPGVDRIIFRIPI